MAKTKKKSSRKVKKITKKHNYKPVIWLLVIVLVVMVVAIILQYTNKNTYTFSCAGGKAITAKFNTGQGGSVDLTLSDGRKMNLPVTASAGGARYANSDESVVFWNTGDTASLEESDETTYNNCVAK